MLSPLFAYVCNDTGSLAFNCRMPLAMRLSGLGHPRPGDEVVIFGLAKAPELNGKKVGVTT